MRNFNIEWLIGEGWVYKGSRKGVVREVGWKGGRYYFTEGKVEECFKKERVINNIEIENVVESLEDEYWKYVGCIWWCGG